MFVVTALVYPCMLALLCIGAGLLVDWASGGWLPAMLLPAVGAATLVAVSQLSTYASFAAPATPVVLVLVALGGFALGGRRAGRLLRGGRRGGRGDGGQRHGRAWREGNDSARHHGQTWRKDEDRSRRHHGDAWRENGWRVGVFVLGYLLALAPVLAAGRPSFSSFGALTDSAFHMLGADYLIRHGQSYGGLDLRNSYGQYIHAYYATGYPSGADTLFGGSAFVMAAPLIWAFQPFNAFVLACAAGPLWLLLARSGLRGGWLVVATLLATLPALVYGYELVASVKELLGLTLILALGVLAVVHERWLWRGARGVIPFALVLAAGVATLGVGFGAWGLTSALVPAAAAAGEIRAGRRRGGELLGSVLLGGAILGVGALSTWTGLSHAVHTATNIATTGNPGNLSGSLRLAQTFGAWLVGSYTQTPSGAALAISYALVALTLLAAVLGALRLYYMGESALLAWIGLTIAVGLGLHLLAGSWVGAKALLITSPVVLLLAWSGVAGLRAARPRWAPAAALGLALALGGGIAVSDALQYRDSNLAPTARYEELATIGRRFSGRGPILFGGFDEYALYELRDVDVGGISFLYPPVGLRQMNGHGYPVDLDRVPPRAWLAYPLVLTRRDPTASEPPAAYTLVWQGVYYQVWARRPGTPAAIAHVGLNGARPVACARVRGLARVAAAARGALLVAARAPRTVAAPVAQASHPGWRYTHPGLVLSGAGTLRSAFTLPRAGVWELWLRGQMMPRASALVDGRPVGAWAGQLDGNPHDPSALTPLRVRLAAGRHSLTLARGTQPLAPGAGGWAIVHEILLTPAAGDEVDTLLVRSPARWRSLCGGRYDWIEVTRGGGVARGGYRAVSGPAAS